MAASVLCVDNDRSFCQIVSKALAGAGYRVLQAHDGDQALAVLDAETPDAVLLDVLLPRRDGFEVLTAMRRREDAARALPVLMISGCTPSPEYQRRAAELGAAALLTKPIPLDDLLAGVAELVGDAKSAEAVPEADGPAPAAGAPRELSGSLRRLPFPALLHHLHGLRAAGVLHLASGRKRKWIQLRAGYPVAIRSNLVNECLGNYLVREGRITRAELERSLPHVKAGRRQGEILVGMQALSEQEMVAALRAQGEEKLFEIFSWGSGSFRFEIGARLQRASSFGVERSPANLILRGVRTRFPLQRIRPYLEAHRDCFAAPGESPFYRFQEIDLDPSQMRMLRRIDGRRPLHELLEDEAAERTLYALVATGLVELRGARPDGDPAAAHVRSERRREPGPRRPEQSEQRARLAAMAERFRDQSPFEVLGVAEDASEEEIRNAYARMAERTHPDRVDRASPVLARLAADVFAHVSDAFESLIDPRRRQELALARRRAEREAAERDEGRRALDAEIEYQRGQERLAGRSFAAALAHFGRALELYPDEGDYHAHYGWALHLCHSDDASVAGEAIEHVRRGIKLAGDREKPYLLMGRLCLATGRPGAAEKMFTRAVHLQPDCVEALRELRLINMRREKSRGLISRLLRR